MAKLKTENEDAFIKYLKDQKRKKKLEEAKAAALVRRPTLIQRSNMKLPSQQTL